MHIALERRAERSATIAIASPLIAIALTLVTMAILFAILGKNPITALGVYFIDPLTDSYSLIEIAVKATPLVMIAVGLSLCYIANVWNIGAEGQFLIGAVCGSWIAVKTQGTDAGAWVLPAMLVAGAVGGALYALIPAICKVRFGASEILTSLMLVYVAELVLDYLVRGPWRDPNGYNFPTTAEFDPVATVPTLIEGSRLHLGAVIALVVVMIATVLLGRTIMGFEIRVVGAAPRAARFAGFDADRLVIVTFLISGALAGLAGIIEVAGPVGHLQPGISPGYGFTAIIVAFLGRLNPVGILIAGLFLALTFIGGEQAQIAMKVPLDLTKVFQGILLFYVLACDSLDPLSHPSGRPPAPGPPMGLLEAILLSVIAASTPLLLAASGELVVERSGVLNLGIEGMMIMGAACGFAAAYFTGSITIGAIAGALAGAGMSAIFALLTLGARGQPGRGRARAHHLRHRPVGADRRELRRRADRTGGPPLHSRPHRHSGDRKDLVRRGRLRLRLGPARHRHLVVPLPHPCRPRAARGRRQPCLRPCARLSGAEDSHPRGAVRRRLRRASAAPICRSPIRRSSCPA